MDTKEQIEALKEITNRSKKLLNSYKSTANLSKNNVSFSKGIIKDLRNRISDEQKKTLPIDIDNIDNELDQIIKNNDLSKAQSILNKLSPK